MTMRSQTFPLDADTDTPDTPKGWGVRPDKVSGHSGQCPGDHSDLPVANATSPVGSVTNKCR